MIFLYVAYQPQPQEGRQYLGFFILNMETQHNDHKRAQSKGLLKQSLNTIETRRGNICQAIIWSRTSSGGLWTHHAQHSVQGEGDVGNGGAAQVHCWPEGLQVKYSLDGLMGRPAVAFLTGEFAATQTCW